MEYGLTPRSITIIVIGWTATALSIWLAHRWRASRNPKDPDLRR